MRAIRSISEPEMLTLKRACDAAYDLMGTMSLFLPFTRAKVSQLSKYASDAGANAETFMPIDIAIEADRRAKDPVIVREMARMQGYRLVADTQGRAAPRELTDSDILSLLTETHDVHRAIMIARADGKIDALDRKAIAKEVREAMRELQDILNAVGGD